MSLKDRFKNLGYKVFLLIVDPINGFKFIEEDPDFLGPTLIIGFSIFLRIIYEMLITRKIYIWNKMTSLEYISLYSLRLSIIQLIIAMRVVEGIILLLVIFAIYYIFSYVLKGEGDSYTFLSAVGYMFTIQMINFILALIFLLVFYPSFPNLMLIYNNDPFDLNVETFGYKIWFEESLSQLQGIVSFLGWFTTVWSAILGIFLLNIIRKISIKKSIVGGIIAYTVSAVISMFVQSIFG